MAVGHWCNQSTANSARKTIILLLIKADIGAAVLRRYFKPYLLSSLFLASTSLDLTYEESSNNLNLNAAEKKTVFEPLP